MQIVIDAETGKVSSTESHGGVVGFISWRRLAEMFREAGETKAGEKMISYKLDDHGIHYRVRQSR